MECKSSHPYRSTLPHANAHITARRGGRRGGAGAEGGVHHGGARCAPPAAGHALHNQPDDRSTPPATRARSRGGDVHAPRLAAGGGRGGWGRGVPAFHRPRAGALPREPGQGRADGGALPRGASAAAALAVGACVARSEGGHGHAGHAQPAAAAVRVGWAAGVADAVGAEARGGPGHRSRDSGGGAGGCGRRRDAAGQG